MLWLKKCEVEMAVKNVIRYGIFLVYGFSSVIANSNREILCKLHNAKVITSDQLGEWRRSSLSSGYPSVYIVTGRVPCNAMENSDCIKEFIEILTKEERILRALNFVTNEYDFLIEQRSRLAGWKKSLKPNSRLNFLIDQKINEIDKSLSCKKTSTL